MPAGAPMRQREVIALMVSAAVLSTACSRLTFIRPDMGGGDYVRTAPTYEFRDDPATKQRNALRSHLVLAGNALRIGRLDEAEGEARAALKIDTGSADAYTLLAVIEAQRGNDGQAGGYYARAAELAPQQGAALNNYGAWLCGNGRAAESLAWFDRALADAGYRERASALANAGSCAMKAGQAGRVERDLREALSLEPENPTALAAMAEYQYRNTRYMDARAFSERRLAAAPATSSVLLLASQIEEKLGDMAAASRYVQRLRTEFPRTGTVQTGESSQP
jgi:type IV pilus assembly protein PilF